MRYCGCHDTTLKKKFLNKKDFLLEKVLAIDKDYEAVTKQAEEMNTNKSEYHKGKQNYETLENYVPIML
jgi:hypothetical protein